MGIYSTQSPSGQLIKEIVATLKKIKWGSLEVFVQDGDVTQITAREIKKINNNIK